MGLDKNQKERLCKYAYHKGNKQAKQNGNRHSRTDSCTDPVFFSCSVILSYKGGKCISKVLNRHIGKGIDLYRCGKGSHHHRSEAVYQSLYHKDAKIHHRLLDTGKKGKLGNFS